MKNILTLRLVVLSFLFLFSINSFSQTDPFVSINQDLRDMFQDLDKPNPERLFHYDMVAHLVDEAFYTHYATDTSNADNWWMLYDEMYNAAYDTLSMETTAEVFSRAYSNNLDTIPIGIIDYDYYTFKDDALSTDIYFDFDTVANKIIDKYPRPDYPYDVNNLFAAAPLIGTVPYANNTFRIDPDFILTDDFNADYYTRNYQLKIDFSDGNGWIEFEASTVTHHDVVYPEAGEYTIIVGIFSGATDPDKVSVATLRVASGTQTIPPSYIIDNQPGLTAGVVRGCNNDGGLNKVIIFLEGFDIMNNTGLSKIYQEKIVETGLSDLLNYGYDFVIIDWNDGRISMKQNADYLINFIDYLKCEINNDHQFVIIGHSMGGVIGNYALAKMENTESEVERCELEQRHNTRLLITIDSPHNGANIPLAIQHLYKDAFQGFNSLYDLRPALGSVQNWIFEGFNLFLESDAAQEQLIYHYSAKVNPIQNPDVYKEYESHKLRELFLNELNSYGGRPRNCKVVALSNGSLRGRKQTRPYDALPRTPNDFLLKFDGKIYARILGIVDFPIFKAKFHLQTNPNGDGKVYSREAGTYNLKLKVYWFGIKVIPGFNSVSFKNEFVHTEPICVSAGGIFAASSLQPGGSTFDAGFNAYLFSVSSSNDGNGFYEFHTSVGAPWLANGNASFSIYSDGFHTNFVPTWSGMGMNTSLYIGLNSNYEAMDINNKLNQTPFDVIAGIPESEAFPFEYNNLENNISIYNRLHSNVQNSIINSTAVTDPNFFRTHMSCPVYSNDNTTNNVWIINREIGDDILWLENMNLNRGALYESEYDIHVNVRNPYYEYPSQPNPYITSDYIQDGFYSKENIFNISNGGEATFKYDAINSPTGIGLDYQPPFTGLYNELNSPLSICCLNYTGFGARYIGKETPPNVNNLMVYPNPSDANEITVELVFAEGKDIDLAIFDLYGRLIFQTKVVYNMDHLQKKVKIDLSSLQLTSGTYIIMGLNKGGKAYQKLIIQKQ